MTVRFVFLAQLKEKAGTDEVIISLMPESDEAHPTVLKALKEMGVEAPIFRSANLPGGDAYNKKLFEKYGGRCKHLV